ncbi:membrane protein [Mycolicibacter terrae]|uniref:Membrane protein n=1 Tax=Mycolicibacter terrae TaxID=1788 RepID=A0AAD1HVS5_9MYCO|nr:membrane protein [Mycolicibacter terrae]SNV89563.1 putative transmembrane protein [Mycolicibacter terrae]
MTAVEPVRVRSDFDAPSRWLWLVKWCVLAVPHYPILIGLYLLYPLATIVAGVAILFTGRYPRRIFDFNVGVLRWSWRVMNYRFPMNSTDKYPPFTLASRPDYPADLEIDYPDRLAGGAVLVKWWLLGLPQILLCWAMEPLLQLLCVFAAVMLAANGTIPPGVRDLLLGIVRWRYRVAAYVSLMRDEYPPFRLDQGDEAS